MSGSAAGAGAVSGPWTDTHCHLQDLGELEPVVERALERRVERIVCVGTGTESSRQAVGIARSLATAGSARPLVWATVGLHPHDAKDGLDPLVALLDEVLPADGAARSLPGSVAPRGAPGSVAPRGAPGSVVGIGECGLDYHYDHSPRDVQREVFAAQVALARRHDLTLVIHTREAWDDTFAILAAEGVPGRTIVHCFTGGPEEARRCLDLGAYVSFSGIATFKGAPEVREAAALCPVDRVLVETDSPFLAPVPYRGRPNEPAYVAVVGEAVAAAREVAADELAAATNRNAVEAFGLALPGAVPGPGPHPHTVPGD